MKRLIAATAIALAANTAFANDVTSTIPAAQLSGAAAVASDTADTVADPFGNQDVISIVPAAPTRDSSATAANQALASQAGRFGNQDVTSTIQ